MAVVDRIRPSEVVRLAAETGLAVRTGEARLKSRKVVPIHVPVVVQVAGSWFGFGDRQRELIPGQPVRRPIGRHS